MRKKKIKFVILSLTLFIMSTVLFGCKHNVYKPIVNLNIKKVDNGLFMVYNTNIRNFYLNERNKH